MKNNPIIWSDFPDLDVILVEDTYYMVSTTMHFMPGCVILRSYDLIHWEYATYVFDRLDSTEGQRLEDVHGIYGKGMWAASLRYHKGKFYVCFVANDTQKTYLYTAESMDGSWKKSTIEGFYHDCSLLFDEDRVFIAYGNREIWLTELNADLSGPLEGGIHKIILKDTEEYGLGFEGCHLYKINGKYYMFFIHWPKHGTGRRQEACYYADTIDGEYRGGNVLDDDMGYHNQGVAQGGIVQAPDGQWYAILFQDHGAVGRIPVVVPMHFEHDFPVFGIEGKVPFELNIASTRPDYQYAPLFGDDDFRYLPGKDGLVQMNKMWQWNHEPDHTCYSFTERPGYFRIRTKDLRKNVVQAVNTLTQRTFGPKCSAVVTVSGTQMQDGDFAGISAFEGKYYMIALTKDKGQYFVCTLIKNEKEANPNPFMGSYDDTTALETSRVAISRDEVTLKIECDFTDSIDLARVSYLEGTEWNTIGETVHLQYMLDHFAGCRFALSYFSTQKEGGCADFSHFRYMKE